MKTQQHVTPLPPCIEAIKWGDTIYIIERVEDYKDAQLPEALREFFATRQAPYTDPLLEQYEAEQQAKKAAEFEAFKARSGEPSYKAAAVKIAAEKLGLTPPIESALDALINADGDKALLVWWIETDAISRGDAQWQRVEGAVSWGKSSADDLFALAAQV